MDGFVNQGRLKMCYNFRKSNKIQERCFGTAKILKQNNFDIFSLPPTSHASDKEYVVIKRPIIKSLQGFIESYL
jgi:hypothetical protein